MYFPFFVNLSGCRNKSQVLVVREFIEGYIVNMRAVWWKVLDAV